MSIRSEILLSLIEEVLTVEALSEKIIDMLHLVEVHSCHFKVINSDLKTQSANSLLANFKGQVAIFIALIFQVLFVFFAMIINVGLLVNHKINLQNSVDLAAYYGAMKQAQVLNVIGHTNYQIRQSWKLLAWRYRQLGSAGDFEMHPFSKESPTFTMPTQDENTTPASQAFYDAPAFCITYVPFREMPQDENTCKQLNSMSGIALWDIPKLIAGFQGFSHTYIKLSETMRDQALDRCRYFGSFNYAMLAKFEVGFNLDQANRMELIIALSKGMSKDKTDFTDVEGESAADGIKKTLKNTLTSPNLESLGENDVEIFNSFAEGDECSGSNGEFEPPKWLVPVRIFPAFNYVDTKCDDVKHIGVEGRMLNNDPSGLPRHYQDGSNIGSTRQMIDKLRPWVGFPPNTSGKNALYFMTVGVEKNPWCMGYLGVKAKTRPKIPFMPAGAIELEARAFAKPFGGRIGPWYGKTWPSTSATSAQTEGNNDTKTDPLLPPRVIGDISAVTPKTAKEKTRAANFSRFIGDKLGFKSRFSLAIYGRAIYALDPAWNQKVGTMTSAKGGTPTVYNGEPAYDMWNDVGQAIDDFPDIMAWDRTGNKEARIRAMEMSAILPDPFDVAYYSIEPDFYNNYVDKLKKFSSKVGKNVLIRPDLGFHPAATDLDKFNVIGQFKKVWQNQDSNFQQQIIQFLDSHLKYVAKEWPQVLTSWIENNLYEYKADDDKFGKCKAAVKEDDAAKAPTVGNCIHGGRTGYSVKLVSKDYLSAGQVHELGGEGAGQAAIKNPPPDDF